MKLDRLELQRREGDEAITNHGTGPGFQLAEFWRWSASDLVSNAQRGVLAEFLVARAVGTDQGVRKEWDACDLRLHQGTSSEIRIEVKAAGYVQTWAQRVHSQINFAIARKRGWDASNNENLLEPCRFADVHVFALHHHRDQESIDPLDMSQWTFHVLATAVLDRECGAQKTLALGALERLSPRRVAYDELTAALIREVAASAGAGV